MVNSAGSFKPSWVHSVASNGVMSERGSGCAAPAPTTPRAVWASILSEHARHPSHRSLRQRTKVTFAGITPRGSHTSSSDVWASAGASAGTAMATGAVHVCRCAAPPRGGGGAMARL